MCYYSDLKESVEVDVITEYEEPIIYEKCIINYRLLYGHLWTVYSDYREEKQYYKMPFLIGYLLQVMHLDRNVLLEEKLRRENEQ